MESGISNELIEMLREALKCAEPYSLDSKEAVVLYDDPRLEDGHPEKSRLVATIALKFMKEHGIEFDTNRP